jgi:hypothetical protein
MISIAIQTVSPPHLAFAPPKGAYFWLQSLLSAAYLLAVKSRFAGARKQRGPMIYIAKLKHIFIMIYSKK